LSRTTKDRPPLFELQQNVDLRPFNTMGVSAIAERFVSVESGEALKALHEEGVATPDSQVLGGGSNVLFVGRLEQTFLRNRIRFVEVENESGDDVTLKVGAGNEWHALVAFAVSRQWGGIENLAFIPGTAGAAPIQNIGAYGVELRDCFVSLEAFDLQSGDVRTFTFGECEFDYRDSVFKGRYRGRYLILSVTLRLTRRNHRIHHSYKSLSDWLAEQDIRNPDIADIFRAVVEIRKSKLPDPLRIGNAGSFFKNPLVGREDLERLQSVHGQVPYYPAEENYVKVPAGWLIEKAGWKGYREGEAGIYDKQALVIVNHGNATGEEIFNLSERVRKSVVDQFGVDLVREVTVIGSRNG